MWGDGDPEPGPQTLAEDSTGAVAAPGESSAFSLRGLPDVCDSAFSRAGAAALQRALWVLLHDKPPSLILAVVITVLGLLLWRRAGWMAKLLLASAAVIAILAAVSTWINPFEHMFHPLGEPKYLAADRAAIDANDMVIAVTLGGESRAYPIREMGYHHIVNDRLHGLPIVVTY